MATDLRLKAGDTILVEIPVSNGHEQYGTRPAIVVAKATRGTITVLPLTTNEEALLFPHTLPIKPSPVNGLNSFSVALIYQIRVLDLIRCKRKLGTLSRTDYFLVRKILKKYLAL